MKTLEEVLRDHKDHETTFDGRLGRRLVAFLTPEQAEQIGYKITEGAEKHSPLEWTEANILKELKRDLEFGIEKAVNHRGISASLMQEVVTAWCWILENGLDNCDYGWYGSATFEAVDAHYGFGLVDENTFDSEFYREW